LNKTYLNYIKGGRQKKVFFTVRLTVRARWSALSVLTLNKYEIKLVTHIKTALQFDFLILKKHFISVEGSQNPFFILFVIHQVAFCGCAIPLSEHFVT